MTEAETRNAGRAAVVSDGGQPWTVSTDRIIVGISGVLQESAESLDLCVDPASGQAPWSRGQVEVVADVSELTPSSGAADWFYLEVNVIGVLSSVKTVLARFAFGPGKLLAAVDIDRPYERIMFESKQVDPNDEDDITPFSLGFTGIGRFYR